MIRRNPFRLVGERHPDCPPTPRRITFALDEAELYGPEVDEALGVREPTVDNWEAGIEIPTPMDVERLAALTRKPLSYFYLPEPEPMHGMFLCGPNGCEVVDERPDAPVEELFKETLW